jgi:hypothetical protein
MGDLILSRTSTPPSALPGIPPSRGEISQSPSLQLLISPLEGEMGGSPEGGKFPTGWVQQ